MVQVRRELWLLFCNSFVKGSRKLMFVLKWKLFVMFTYLCICNAIKCTSKSIFDFVELQKNAMNIRNNKKTV